MILVLMLLLNTLPACPAEGRVTSEYGWRTDPFTDRKSYHQGVDIAAPKGTPIRAMWAGKVVYAERSMSYGNLIVIKHPHGWRTRYAHASRLLIKEGDQVHTGQIIGRVGSTGRSTGNHLHLEMRFRGKRKDPKRWLMCEK